MTDQISIFECVPGGEQYLPKPSTDWRWTFADYPKVKNGLKVFSCFACGGGSTMGYKLAGCDVIGDCEIDPKMNELYIKNHNPRFNYLMDIREFNKIKTEELPPELFDLDILDGSPPCTTFSTAGKREETWGKAKKFREGQKEQTLDDLLFIFIETAKKLKPRVVIMENVEGLLLGEAFQYVQRIYKEFAEAGYIVNHWLLKAETMGVPQTRHRVFFIALRKDLNKDPRQLDMYWNYSPVYFKELNDHKGKKVAENTKTHELITNATKIDKSLADVNMRLYGKMSRFNDCIVWDNNIVPTIRATGGTPHIVGAEYRYVSAGEMISAQTFPIDYEFNCGSTSVVQYVCGMSVPPIMIKRIVERLIESNVFDYRGLYGNQRVL